MKRTRFTEEQIIGILTEQEAGVPVADLQSGHLAYPFRSVLAGFYGATLADFAPPLTPRTARGVKLVISDALKSAVTNLPLHDR